MTLVIDAVDFGNLAPEYGYEVGYTSIDGGGGKYMLDGTMSVDELNKKAVLTIPLYPLTNDQLRSLLSVLMPEPVHLVTYDDPWIGTRSVRMIRSMPTQKSRGKGGTGNDYWTGTVLTLTEK